MFLFQSVKKHLICATKKLNLWYIFTLSIKNINRLLIGLCGEFKGALLPDLNLDVNLYCLLFPFFLSFLFPVIFLLSAMQ